MQAKNSSFKELLTCLEIFYLFIIFLLFVVSFINTVVFIITITSKAQLFQDTSFSFLIQYLFFCVIIQALIDAIINAALAYVAVRTRKNLTRGLETACVGA